VDNRFICTPTMITIWVIFTEAAAVVQWLMRRTYTQQAWIQLPLVPYESLVEAGRTSGQITPMYQ